MQIDNPYVIKKIRETKKGSDIENIRLNMYSIFSALILSKNIFKKNIEVAEFLQRFNIEFKSYVVASRTLMLSRVLKEIEKTSDENLFLFVEIIADLFSDDETKRDSDKTNSRKNATKRHDSYVDSILNKYSRRRD